MWLNLSGQDATDPGLPERFFAVGEEKTDLKLPPGYGYAYKASDHWLLDYMLHNLTPNHMQVWITYDIDFIPATSPAAKGIQPARPIWMDVQNGETYPVFNVPKGGGHGGEYTYPDDATNPYLGGPAKNVWTVDQNGTLLETAGHVHPGGLRDDLWLQRAGTVVPDQPPQARHHRHRAPLLVGRALLRARGARVVGRDDVGDDRRAGACRCTRATSCRSPRPTTRRNAVVVRGDGDHGRLDGGGERRHRPVHHVGERAGVLTHGHLAEDDNHGGPTPDLKDYVDETKLPSKMVPNGYVIPISNFVYARAT